MIALTQGVGAHSLTHILTLTPVVNTLTTLESGGMLFGVSDLLLLLLLLNHNNEKAHESICWKKLHAPTPHQTPHCMWDIRFTI